MNWNRASRKAGTRWPARFRRAGGAERPSNGEAAHGRRSGGPASGRECAAQAGLVFGVSLTKRPSLHAFGSGPRGPVPHLPLVPQPRGGEAPLSLGQERPWVLQRLPPHSPAYSPSPSYSQTVIPRERRRVLSVTPALARDRGIYCPVPRGWRCRPGPGPVRRLRVGESGAGCRVCPRGGGQ